MNICAGKWVSFTQAPSGTGGIRLAIEVNTSSMPPFLGFDQEGTLSMAQSTRNSFSLAVALLMAVCCPLFASPDFDPSSFSIDDDVKEVQERLQKQMDELRSDFLKQLEMRNQEFEKRISQIREMSALELDKTKLESRTQLEVLRNRAAGELEAFGKRFEQQITQLKSMADEKSALAQTEIERLTLENENLRKMIRELRGVAVEVAGGDDGDGNGDDDSRPRARLGISVLPGDDQAASMVDTNASLVTVVSAVTPGGAADRLGLKPGDVITHVDGKSASLETIQSVVGDKKVGDEIVLIWARRGSDGVLKSQVRGVLGGRGRNTSRLEERIEETRTTVEVVDNAQAAEAVAASVASSPGVSLGVSVIQEEGFGVRVTEVDAGTNATAMGLEVGDVITGVGGARIRTIEGLRDILSRTQPGSAFELRFSRSGRAWVAQGTLATSSGDGARRASLERASSVRGFLGIVPAESGGGLVIQEVIEGTCASQMGLRSGDRLVAVGGKTTPDLASLRASLEDLRAGDTLKIAFSRDGEALERRGTLGEFPNTEEQSASPRSNRRSESSTIASKQNGRSATVSSKPATRLPSREPAEPALGIAVVWSESGINIERVFPGSLAEEAGLELGDRLLRIEDTTIDSLDAIRSALENREQFGVVFEVERGLDTLVLMTRPRDVVAAFDETVEIVPAAANLVPEETPFLGMDVEQNSWGIMVTGIVEGLPAHAGGLLPGDWIISICDTSVETIEDMQTALQYQGLHSVSIRVRRGMETVEGSVPLILPQ